MIVDDWPCSADLAGPNARAIGGRISRAMGQGQRVRWWVMVLRWCVEVCR